MALMGCPALAAQQATALFLGKLTLPLEPILLSFLPVFPLCPQQQLAVEGEAMAAAELLAAAAAAVLSATQTAFLFLQAPQ